MHDPSILLLLANAASTWYMVGLIWMVQVVHYPLFARVGQSQFPDYQDRHQWRTTWVVGPPMLIEAGTSIALAWLAPPTLSPTGIVVGIVLVLVIWLSTAVLQVPCHGRLADQFDAAVHRRLVLSNWIRTLAWSARGVLVGGFLIDVIG